MGDGWNRLGTATRGGRAGAKRGAVAVAAAAGLCLLAAAPATVVAQEAMGGPAGPAAKDQYTLLNPVPRNQLRELSPDRPDRTESPFTVDAGHLQGELSFIEWTKGDADETTSVLPTNLKLGLTRNVDVQLVVNPNVRVHTGGRSLEGVGDTQLRLKVNLWGNDGGEGFFGKTALAVMPYIQFPSADDKFGGKDDYEGGVLVPFTMPLPREFALTVMAEVDVVRDAGGGHDTLFVHTASLGRDIYGPLGGYVEYIGVLAFDGDRDYEASFSTGLTYQVNEDVQLDIGGQVGLTGDAPDFRVFAGMTFRI